MLQKKDIMSDINMDYGDYLKQKEKIEKLSTEEQKKFYEQLLKNKQDKTEVRVDASFCYGHLFYQEGDFGKTIEIIEPIVVDYQSYPYTPKMLSCFNLIGVATHCEAEYSISRFFYETALKLARENDARFYYAFEYNNIALSYIAEQNYRAAIKNLNLAEDVLDACDEEMGAYIYINKSISFQKLAQLPEALHAFKTAMEQYHADQIVPDDVLRCAATLYYKLGQKEEYEKYKQQILAKMDSMYAAEFMDACNELFECGMDSDDDELMTSILHSMDAYMETYPDEIKVGLAFAELNYLYAIKKKDNGAILKALEAKNNYKDRIIAYSMEKRVKSLEHYIEINSKISDLELDALTGFKNRKAYYKDIDMIERDQEISKQPVGVVFADVNGLKEVNDCLGHEAGDKLITFVAKAITEVFPEAKRYRFGGDEFVILSFDKNETAFHDKLKKLSGLWKDNYSASIGSVWKDHAKNFEKIISAADEVMYLDKSRYYEKKMHDRRSQAPVGTEESLKKIEEIADLLPGGFFVYYADAEEKLITFNQELLKIFKCENQEEFIKLTGNSFKGMVHPDDLNIVESEISSQIQQEQDIDQVHYRIKCNDGTIKTVVDYGRFVHTEMYGDVYYVFMNDISDNR